MFHLHITRHQAVQKPSKAPSLPCKGCVSAWQQLDGMAAHSAHCQQSLVAALHFAAHPVGFAGNTKQKPALCKSSYNYDSALEESALEEVVCHECNKIIIIVQHSALHPGIK